MLSFAQELKLDWRQIGNSAIRHQTGDVATGPLDRAWFTTTGLAAHAKSGEVWESTDGEVWKISSIKVPAQRQRESAGRIFRVDGDALRSDDGGRSWTNLTRFRGKSILGGPLFDIAVSPVNPDDVLVAGSDGVWRSLDGGSTWAGLNQALPNLHVKHILELPSGTRGIRVATEDTALEWHPGQKLGWTVAGTFFEPEAVVAIRGSYIYTGFADGRILTALDGVARPIAALGPAKIEAIWVDRNDPAVAVAVAGLKVFRTFNGGTFWDDITGPLRAGTIHGVAADPVSGSIYVAGDGGVFYAFEFNSVGEVASWTKLALPVENRKANDVRLDLAANQIYAAIDGYGVFAAMAPHRRKQPVLVSAADSTSRPAAPGSLMSILGQAVTSARSGDRLVPVLAANGNESQVQVPFEVQGREMPLRLENGTSNWNVSIALDEAAPAVFVENDGTPMLLDGDSGVLLDAMNPARSGTRLQILATGLGRVKPDWPTGLAAPIENPPGVIASVRVLLDGQALEVTRATLAPGYVGFYLIEAEVPALVNSGTAELYIEASGRASNHVRVYIEP